MRLATAIIILVLGIAQARADEQSWTGKWNTRWRDGGALMILHQQGAAVSGTYPAYGGRVEGTVAGRTLTGRWIEGPRSGGIVFVMAPDGETFMGRFTTGEWWTGGRVRHGTGILPIDQTGAREALATFVSAGNSARRGAVDDWAVAAAVMDFGPAGDGMAPGEKLAAARRLFEVLDLTTFQLWSIPGKRAPGDRLDLTLHQAGTDAVLPLALVRHGDQGWFVAMPDIDTLAGARRALLVRSGGRMPASDDYKRRRSARDALRTFMAGFDTWDDGGRAEVLGALDLSTLSEATRGAEGDLAAEYLDGILDRIGDVTPQEVPDDPASRQPYVLFSHPEGQVAIAPSGDGVGPDWQFTTATVRNARNLYTSVEDMPLAGGGSVPDPPSIYFALRSWIRLHAPALLGRIGEVETWQAAAVAALLVGGFAVAWGASLLLLAALRRAVGGRQVEAERTFRWPLRLAITFAVYQIVVPVFGLPEATNRFSTGASGVLLAVSVMWGGWELLNTLGGRLVRAPGAGGSTVDEILVSLLLVVAKVVLLAGGLMFIASELSLPYNGLIAGLGIGGLALAFASKETLSNVFGAGILVADRPFRRGDWIVAGDVQGTVEHVGVRSTRVRTAADSLMIVPNGKLSDATVNNLGTRRTRLVQASIPVAYDTPPPKVEAFIDGLRDMTARVPRALPARTVVTVDRFGAEVIEVGLLCTIDDRTGTSEVPARNAMMLGVLRLARELDIRLGEVPADARSERGMVEAPA